jgi:hypothetical protein
VIINEITVSRSHCLIKYSDAAKTIEIIDSNSKFGTVVKKPSLLVNKKECRLQKGRTYM